MTSRCSRWPFITVSLLSFAFGCFYLSLNHLTRYHQAFIGIPFHSLPPALQTYILGLLHIVGLLMMCLSLALFAFTAFPSKPLSQIDLIFIILFTLTPLITLLYFARLVKNGAPWWLAALNIFLLLWGARPLWHRKFRAHE